MKYTVNVESLHRNFPSEWKVPSLLLEFANWLKDKTPGRLGYFSLQSERFDDYWIENGADLHSNFAFFVRDPTGGRIGYWLYEGQATESAPIVLLGSEGETKILAASLDEFLRRLAEGTTGAADLDSHDGGKEDGAELTEWLSVRKEQTPQKARAIPDLSTWLDNWGQQQRDWINSNVYLQKIADRLRKYVKADAQPWETTNFDVLLVGSRFEIWHRSYGLHALPTDEIPELERLFRSVREERAQVEPKRGLWFSTWVKVGAEGGAVLCCNFMDEPNFLDYKPLIPVADYMQDLQSFPRSNHWIPEWLK